MQQELDSYSLLGALPPSPSPQVFIRAVSPLTEASTGLFPRQEGASRSGGVALLVQGMG